MLWEESEEEKIERYADTVTKVMKELASFNKREILEFFVDGWRIAGKDEYTIFLEAVSLMLKMKYEPTNKQLSKILRMSEKKLQQLTHRMEMEFEEYERKNKEICRYSY